MWNLTRNVGKRYRIQNDSELNDFRIKENLIFNRLSLKSDMKYSKLDRKKNKRQDDES